jgi:hypothetical protein
VLIQYIRQWITPERPAQTNTQVSPHWAEMRHSRQKPGKRAVRLLDFSEGFVLFS